MIKSLLKLPRSSKRNLCLVADVVLVSLSVWISMTLYYGKLWPSEIQGLIWLAPLAIATALPIFTHMGLYRVVHRYITIRFFYTIAKAVTLHALLFTAIGLLSGQAVHLTVFVLYWLIALTLISASRWVIQDILRDTEHKKITPRRVIVYGAGSAGAELVEALLKSNELEPVAFIDDKAELHGREILGLRIYPTQKLTELIEKHQAKQVLLAIPSASKDRRRELITFLEKFSVRVKTVPALSDIISGQALVEDIREIDVNDLLERDPVLPNERLLTENTTGKSVMVTGAGGSIGSELCRNIIKHNPIRLVLFEMSEAALYLIDKEMRAQLETSENPNHTEIIPILGTVLNEKRLLNLLKTFNVQTLYHAAAYKHVPLVEYNPIVGIENNVIGTWRTVQAALTANITTFILISSDKAVRPTNVMGTSKRLAELVVQGLAKQSSNKTQCSIVRFGNVLGSSGSVVPLFQEQIRSGGPITVTDPEMIRYFMTIPEAAELVIQAGSMGSDGDVFELDMGEPVRIVELARHMINLSGLTVRDAFNPHGDVAIQIIGRRPGEKLYEELLLGNDVTKTEHPRIMRAHEADLPWDQLQIILNQLREYCLDWDVEAVRKLMSEVVAGYQPQCGIKDSVWLAEKQKVIDDVSPSAVYH